MSEDQDVIATKSDVCHNPSQSRTGEKSLDIFCGDAEGLV